MHSVIAIVDYGMGNLRSVAKALEHVAQPGQQVVVTSDAAVINAAERIVFPGQGAARDCMLQLETLGLTDILKQTAAEKPFLGICMGMQVLLTHTEENQGVDCLNLFSGEVRIFTAEKNRVAMQGLKIPHMGWNNVAQTQPHPLWQGISDNSRFYFVHSYYADPEQVEIVAGKTRYGIEFVSVIAQGNVFATQFHPEKSAHDGLQLLSNFTQWDGSSQAHLT